MDLLTRHSDDPLFKYLDPSERKYLMDNTRSRKLEPGEVLIHQGEKDYTMFFIEQGALEVIDERLGDKAVISTLASGDVLGEMAFLNQTPRSATVRAQITSIVREFNRDQLNLIAQEAPEILGKVSLALSEILALRLRDTMETLPGLVQRLQKIQDEYAVSSQTDQEAVVDLQHALTNVHRWLRRSG